MFHHLTRLVRHRWLDHSDAARAIGPDAAARLRERVAASERCHTGEIRLCIEGGLPPSYLWRHWRDRVPMQDIVHQRALMLFSKLRVWDTAENNGVLIYLLLAEHAIEVVADRGLAQRVPPGTWQAVVQRLGSALRDGQFEQGLNEAIDAVTTQLVAHFPASGEALLAGAGRPNQLPDEPVLR